MTTREAIYRVALEHIRDGSDAVCTECGWMGPQYFYCPSCNTLIRHTGPKQIAAYALAQGERRGK